MAPKNIYHGRTEKSVKAQLFINQKGLQKTANKYAEERSL